LKQINDQFGHKEGDQALLKTAKFSEHLSQFRYYRRFGGDEFTALVIEEYGQTPTRSAGAAGQHGGTRRHNTSTRCLSA